MSIGLGRVTIVAAVETSRAALMAGAECGGVSITTKVAPRFCRSPTTWRRGRDPSGSTAGASIWPASRWLPHSAADFCGSVSMMAATIP
jgi:hypothetical protein